MLERLGESPSIFWQVRFFSASVIPDRGLAREVLSVTDDPAEREIIHLTRIEAGADDDAVVDGTAELHGVLGFDVGNWGGPFSLISDTMLYARWHPGPDEAVPVLRDHAANLNEHMLFRTASAAMVYRNWYQTQTWAEEVSAEGGFCVARIDKA